jgi:hypothetical protein
MAYQISMRCIRDSTTRRCSSSRIRINVSCSRAALAAFPASNSSSSAAHRSKELGEARAMANILTSQSLEMRAKGEAMIQQADKLLCESWNERMWSDGEPVHPSPTID